MSTGVIIGIAVCAALLIGLIAVLNRAGQRRRTQARREQAHELRQDAQQRELRATRRQAEADEQSARAKQAAAQAEEKAAIARREEAQAREHAQAADRERRFARERHGQAQSIDPDATDGRDRQPARNGAPDPGERETVHVGNGNGDGARERDPGARR